MKTLIIVCGAVLLLAVGIHFLIRQENRPEGTSEVTPAASTQVEALTPTNDAPTQMAGTNNRVAVGYQFQPVIDVK